MENGIDLLAGAGQEDLCGASGFLGEGRISGEEKGTAWMMRSDVSQLMDEGFLSTAAFV